MSDRKNLVRFDEDGSFEILDQGLLCLVSAALLRPLAVNRHCSGEDRFTMNSVNGNCDVSNTQCVVVANGSCGANGGCPDVVCIEINPQNVNPTCVL